VTPTDRLGHVRERLEQTVTLVRRVVQRTRAQDKVLSIVEPPTEDGQRLFRNRRSASRSRRERFKNAVAAVAPCPPC